jgi:hypothetical protein
MVRALFLIFSFWATTIFTLVLPQAADCLLVHWLMTIARILKPVFHALLMPTFRDDELTTT